MDKETWRHVHGFMDIETSIGKWKTEAPAIFLYPFTVCQSCNLKFVFVRDLQTNRSYPFANGLDRLAHLWNSVRYSKHLGRSEEDGR
jgi:hypothetical protein